MDKLKQNPFWIVMIVAGVVLLGLGYPVYTQLEKRSSDQMKIKTTQRALDTATAKGIPGEPDIKSYGDDGLKGQLKKSYNNIASFYKSSDEKLEAWLVAPPAGAAAPPRGTFMTTYTDARKQLEEKLTNKGIRLGIKDEDVPSDQTNGGFNWEIPEDKDWEPIGADESTVLHDIQKRYWIRKRLADACLASNVTRVKMVYFWRSLHSKLLNPKWGQIPQGLSDFKMPADPVNIQGGIAKDRFSDFDLPGKLGKTITFCVIVEIPFTQAPKFVEQMLNTSLDPALLINVVGCRLSVREQNDPKVGVPYNIPANPADEAKVKDAAKEKAMENVKVKNFQLAVTCQVIDVDSPKLSVQ